MMTDSHSVQHLQSAGHLRRTDDIVPLDLGPHPARGRLNILRLTVRLLGQTLGRGFDVVHLCLPTPAYVPYAAVVRILPRSLRPRIALSVIDCTLAPNLVAGNVVDTYERQVVAAHRLYARWTRLDGIFTWYRAFAQVARRLQLFADGTAIVAAKYCFTDPLHFRPDATRERVIVFAGRLSSQKRPLLFVDAVARLVTAEPELVSDWRFEMYGLGVLEHEVRQRIAAHQLDRILRLSHAPDLARVFARSRLFVSTQAIENFTSLAMLEAMAAGNAVIAEDVGQTREFVRDGENGLLVTDATPE
ncbi:MAG: glycosyltransferase family 4 protein, partial [Vicinamibacterales bacterium]